jgi:hypothetical protein
MARSRNIKPGFFTNDQLAELPALTRLLFVGLWTIADREGRIEDRPKKVKAETMPYDNFDCDEALSDLQKAGFIVRYASGGTNVIQVVNWGKHQNPHVKEQPSTLPALDKHQTSTVQEQDKQQPSTEVAGLIPDSGFLIPDSSPLIPDCSTDVEGAGKPRKSPPKPAAVARPDDIDPQTWTDWLALRKAKRAPVTETVVNGARDEAGKAGMTLDAFLQVWCLRGSQGLQADWLRPEERQTRSRVAAVSFAQQDEQARRTRWEQMTGRTWPAADAMPECIDAEDITTRRIAA